MRALAKAQIVTGVRGFAAMIFTIAASPVLHEAGVSFKTISLGFGVLYSILAIAEIPTGVWADIFGARKSAIVGGILQTLSLAILGLGSTDTWWVLLGFAIYGFGSSFVSGALSALLFGAAKEEDGESFNSNRYFSMIEKVAVASYIVASVLVGFLSESFGRGAFLCAGAFYLAAAGFIAFALSELSPEREFHSTRKEFVARIREGLAAIRQSIQLQGASTYSGPSSG
ncbi:MAG: MFS transporter [Bdellovibrionaceae bacterium]|nr:MFS transporter [Pseudobdellovibrionaceae bacterium]